MPPKKVVEAPSEPNEADLLIKKEHERIISIYVVGKFTQSCELEDAPPPIAPLSEHVEKKRVPSPATKKKDGTGSRGGSAGDSLNGLPPRMITQFPILAKRPFFTLSIPGYSLLQDEQVSVPAAAPETKPVKGRKSATPPALAQPTVTPGPGGYYVARVLPTSSNVNLDGTFKIELCHKLIRVEPETVDAVLSNLFQFEVRTVPEALLQGSSSITSSPLRGSFESAKKAHGGAKGKKGVGRVEPTAEHKGSHSGGADDIAPPSADPAHIPLEFAERQIGEEFDLGFVLTSSKVDRLDLLSTHSCEGKIESQNAPSEGSNSLFQQAVSITTPATDAELTDAQRERNRLRIRDSLPGFDELSIHICCSQPLLSEVNMRRYIPCTIHIKSVINIPSFRTDTVDLNHHMNPRVDDGDGIAVRNDSCTGGCKDQSNLFVSQRKCEGVCVKCTPVRGNGPTYTTGRQTHKRDIHFNERRTFFLYRIPTAELLDFFFLGMRFEMHDRDVNVPNYGPICAGYGEALLPLRRVLYGDRKFELAVQLVPRQARMCTADIEALNVARLTPPRVADYFSNNTTLIASFTLWSSLSVVKYFSQESPLTIPFPTSGPLSRLQHLTRALFIAPYNDPTTYIFIRSLMSNILRYPRADQATSGISAANLVTTIPEPVEETVTPPKSKEEKGAKNTKDAQRIQQLQHEALMRSRAFWDRLPPVVQRYDLFVSEGVSGFELIDGNLRLICIESYPYVLYDLITTTKAALAQLAEAAGEKLDAIDSGKIRVLFNSELAFNARFYHKWPPLARSLQELLGKPTTDPSPVAKPPPEELPADPKTQRGKAQKHAEGQDKKATKRGKAGKTLLPVDEESVDEGQPPIEKREEPAKSAVDYGGVGFRIRRIRLRCPLKDVASLCCGEGAYLSNVAACADRLIRLSTTNSIACALDHDFFPTAEELISLERLAGDTLSVYDICGNKNYYVFTAASGDEQNWCDYQEKEVSSRRDEKSESGNASDNVTTKERDFMNLVTSGLSMDMIGMNFSFVAIPAPRDQLAGLPRLTSSLFPRHEYKNYMRVEGVEPQTMLLCAYTKPPPNQLLRYNINAQVVAAKRHKEDTTDTPLIFVLSFSPLTKNLSDTHNLRYCAQLRRERHRLPRHLYYATMRKRREQYAATHHPPLSGSDDSDEDLLDKRWGLDGACGGDTPPALPTGEALKDVLVSPDFLGMNKHTRSMMKRCKRPIDPKGVQEKLRLEEAQYPLLWKMYNKRGRQLARMVSKVGSHRVKHDKSFVSPLARTVEEARTAGISINRPYENENDDTARNEIKTCKDKDEKVVMRFGGAADLIARPVVTSETCESSAMTHEREREFAQRLKEQWEKRVVVDDMYFHVSTISPREQPRASLDKYANISSEMSRSKTKKMFFVPAAPISIQRPVRWRPEKFTVPEEVKHPERHEFYYFEGTEPKEKYTKPIAPEEVAANPGLFGSETLKEYKAI